MLEIIKAIIYGIVEGITEWLPISSTGHLILVERLIPFQQTSEGFFDMFDVVIQLGAILAVVVLFWNKIWPFYLKKNKQTKKGGIVRSKKDFTVGNVALSMDAFWMWVKIVVACIPAVVYGLLFDDAVGEAFQKEIGSSGVTIQVIVVAVMLVVVGVLFIVIENWNKDRVPTTTKLSQLTYRDALIIGLCQLVARNLPLRSYDPGSYYDWHIENSGSGIYLLFGDSRYVWSQPPEGTEVRICIHGNGACLPAGRYGGILHCIPVCTSFSDGIHQKA